MPLHDDVIKWKHFPRYWPLVRGIHRSPVNSPHKGQWRGALMFCREAGDLRRYRAHYDVIVMSLLRTARVTARRDRNALLEQSWPQALMPLIHGNFMSTTIRSLRWKTAPRLTHWGRDKIATIFQTTFSEAFSWMKMYKLRLKFHWSLFPRVQLTVFQHWFR